MLRMLKKASFELVLQKLVM